MSDDRDRQSCASKANVLAEVRKCDCGYREGVASVSVGGQ